MHEHEPVAWINYNAATGEETINRECHSELASTPLYKTPLQNEITCVCGAVWDGELMTIPPREKKQEPVAWMHPEWRTYTRAPTPCLAPKDGWIPLYTAPPKREWVGLTDDEMQETGRYSYCRGGTSEKLYHIMWNSQPSASVGWCRDELIAFARAIEAKLKEKNA